MHNWTICSSSLNAILCCRCWLNGHKYQRAYAIMNWVSLSSLFTHPLENLEKWESIFQSGNFEHTWESQRLLQKTLDKFGNLFCIFFVIFNLTTFEKILDILKKSGKSVRWCGNPDCCCLDVPPGQHRNFYLPHKCTYARTWNIRSI